MKSFFNGSLFGACYDGKRHKAIVVLDRIARKTCKLLVCQYAHCPCLGLSQSAKPQGKVSCGQLVVPHSVDNGDIIEIHTRKVSPTPLERDRQTEANNESEANVHPNEISIFFSNTRLGSRSPIVERNKHSC